MPDNPRKPIAKPDARMRRADRTLATLRVRPRPAATRCCMLDEILAGLSWFGG